MHKAGERELGKDPKSGRPVFVKIGRFGPVVQIGSADDQVKPQFAQLPSECSMETLTLEEALELFKLPRTVGAFEGGDVVIGTGRFGPYILHKKKYISLPKTYDPMTITLDETVALINEKRQQEEKRHLKTFQEDSKLEVIDGRYGLIWLMTARIIVFQRICTSELQNSLSKTVWPSLTSRRNNEKDYPHRLHGLW